MKIWARVKTWRGDEFCIESLKSIYQHVEGILYVHSDISWTGEKGNTVRDKVRAFPDPDKKIHHVDFDSSDQKAQARAAYDWLVKNADFDYMMIIDTDEVCDNDFWPIALKELKNNLTAARPYKAFTAALPTYIKSPFYQIQPADYFCPTIFVKKDALEESLKSCRAVEVYPRKCLPGAFMHHFCSVRRSFEAVWQKHESSCFTEKEPIVDKEWWRENIWNKLPGAIDICPVKRWRGEHAVWKSIKVVNLKDLPAAIRENEIVKAWEKFIIVPVEQKKDGQEAAAVKTTCAGCAPGPEELKKAGLPPDFGPLHPDWNVPTKQNRYQKALLMTGTDVGASSIAEEQPARAPISAYKHLMSGHRLCITTIVSGAYQHYFPLFWYCARIAYPDAQIMVFLRGENKLPPFWNLLVHPLENGYNKNTDGNITAAMRFTYRSPWFDLFDYVLITDIDILLMQEEPDITHAHHASMRRNKLEKYDNYAVNDNGIMRCPGVHFVTKEWWAATEKARESAEAELMAQNFISSPGHDERMLYKIITSSHLTPPPLVPNTGNYHGVHLGDIRKSAREYEAGAKKLHAVEGMFLKSLKKDKTFMETARQCGEKNEDIKKIFAIIERL